jgi:hypothetical protein
MESENVILILLTGIVIGMLIAPVVFPNSLSEIGLNQRAGNLICQKITNNTNAYAIDWNHKQDEPEDALICEIKHEKIYGGLIQIKN